MASFSAVFDTMIDVRNKNIIHAGLNPQANEHPLIARFMGPTWGLSGADRNLLCRAESVPVVERHKRIYWLVISILQAWYALQLMIIFVHFWFDRSL